MTSTFPQEAVPKTHPLTIGATTAILVGSLVALGYIVGMVGPSTYQSARQKMNQALMNATAPVSTSAGLTANEPLPHPVLLQSQFPDSTATTTPLTSESKK